MMARDYSREYAARKARAAAQGTTVFRVRDKAATSLGYRSYAQRAAAKRTGAGLRPGDVARALRGSQSKRQVIPTPAGTIVRTTPNGRGRAVIENRIRNAKPGAKVTITATVRMSDGTKRDVTLFGRGGWSAQQVAAGIYIHGSLGAFIAAVVAELYGDGADDGGGDDDYDGFETMAAVIS